MISAGDFKNGITVEIDGNIYQILEFRQCADFLFRAIAGYALVQFESCRVEAFDAIQQFLFQPFYGNRIVPVFALYFPCRITLFPIDQRGDCRIRIFLSCSYFGYCHLVHTTVLKLDTTGSVEPVFRFLTCRAALCLDCARLGKRKYRSEARMIFF